MTAPSPSQVEELQAQVDKLSKEVEKLWALVSAAQVTPLVGPGFVPYRGPSDFPFAPPVLGGPVQSPHPTKLSDWTLDANAAWRRTDRDLEKFRHSVSNLTAELAKVGVHHADDTVERLVPAKAEKFGGLTADVLIIDELPDDGPWPEERY